jgi:cbb3-type cytochrome oxidase maturation protein
VESLYLLVPLSVLLVLAIGAVFWWALHAGQFEDLEGPAHRILMDEDAEEAMAVDADQSAPRRGD